jgi:hypothetical protein
MKIMTYSRIWLSVFFLLVELIQLIENIISDHLILHEIGFIL